LACNYLLKPEEFKMNISMLSRGALLAAITFAIGLSMPGIAEANAAKSRSAAERRQRPGMGYFANSPQNRAATQSRAQSPVRQVMPMAVPSQSAVVRHPGSGPAMPVVRMQSVPGYGVPQGVAVLPPAPPEYCPPASGQAPVIGSAE